MITLIGQFNKLNGPDVVKQYKVEFTIDEYQRESIRDLVLLEKGSAVVINLVEVDDIDINSPKLEQELEVETKKRLQKRMHALIREIADDNKASKEDIKQLLRKELIKKKYMKKSTAELTIEGYSAAIYILQNNFK